MEIEEIISEKDRILNDLFEGFFQDTVQTGNKSLDDRLPNFNNLKDLTPAQHYRQKALEMFLDNNWHHMDLEEAWNRILELKQEGNEKLLRDKIINYYLDANELNKSAAGGAGEFGITADAGEKVLPMAEKYRDIIDSSDSIDDAIGKLNELLDNAEASRSLRYEFAEIIENVNRQELYYGIRHVMPESLEMRMLINYGEEYINMLEALNRPSFNTDIFADLDYERIPLSPERLNELGIKNPYIAPNNIAELKEIHQRFLQEFPKKVKEFVLGQNVWIDFNNRDAILGNDEFYQYTGMATASSDMPSIQMSNNLTTIFEKFLDEARQDFMYEKAQAYGFEDANEWFEAVYQEVETDGPNTILWDKATKESMEYGTEVAKNKLNSYFTKPVFNDAFPDEIGFELGRVLPENTIYKAVNNPLDPNIGITTSPDTPTNVVDDVKTLDIENYKPITIEVLDEVGLHARPVAELIASFNNQGIPITILQDGNLKEVATIGLLQQGKTQGETLDIYIPKDADINLDNVSGIKVVGYQGTGIGGSPFEIEDGVPVDTEGNPIKSIGAADETITIYRVVPEGVNSVNANDWVFINKGQAEEALKNANANVDGNFNLIEMEVNKGDVYPSTRGNLEMGYFPTDTPTNVVDDLENKAINQAGEVIDVADDTTTDLSKIVGEGNYNRFTRIAREAPEIVKNIFDTTKKVVGKTFGIGGRVAQVADPGDILIEQSLVRLLPRLGLRAMSVPALIAYTGYELTVLLADVGQALNKARQKQGLGTVNEAGAIFEGLPPFGDADWKQFGKDTWEEMGEISDTWSLSWKISEPIIESVFKQSASMSQEK